MGRRSARFVGRTVAVLALAAGGAVMAGSPAFADTVAPPSVSVQNNNLVYLVARGAALVVPVNVSCQAGSSSYLSVEVVQRVAGGNITRGYGYANGVQCDGTTRTVELSVTAQTRAFQPGPAFAMGNFTACTSLCATATDQREVRVVRT